MYFLNLKINLRQLIKIYLWILEKEKVFIVQKNLCCVVFLKNVFLSEYFLWPQNWNMKCFSDKKEKKIWMKFEKSHVREHERKKYRK